MALPTLSDLKEFLRIEEDNEDVYLAQALARALGMVQRALDVPITAVAREFYDNPVGITTSRPITTLITTQAPIGTVVVTDVAGTTVDSSTYRVDSLGGLILANRGITFGNGPYKIVCECGLSLHPDYTIEVEPIVSAAIIDTAADLYQRRSPAATTEKGGDTTVTWPEGEGLPPRVAQQVRALKRTILAI